MKWGGREEREREMRSNELQSIENEPLTLVPNVIRMSEHILWKAWYKIAQIKTGLVALV